MKKILLLAAITTISLLAANKTFAQYYRHDRAVVERRIIEPRRLVLPLPPAPVIVNPFVYRPGVVVVDRFHRDYRRYRRF